LPNDPRLGTILTGDAAEGPPGHHPHFPEDAMPEIEYQWLVDQVGALERLASWHHAEWSDLAPGWSLDEATRELRENLGRGTIPSTLVALHGEDPIGSASLLEVDFTDLPPYRPWLASVYVLPAWRHRGVGGTLVERIVASARELGLPRLYLFTTDMEHWYGRRGWRVQSPAHAGGEPGVVMHFDLSVGPSTFPVRPNQEDA
jgi:predicted N-acetyltransferase YhbS